MNSEEKNRENAHGHEINKKIKRITGIYLSVFLAVILSISLYINIASFQKQFIANELSFYSVSGGRIVDRIENGLLYGKSLDKFYGIDQILKDWSEKNPEAVNVRLLSADKKTVYYQPAEGESYREAETDDSTYLEVKDEDGNLCGYLNIIVDLGDRKERLLTNQTFFAGGAAVLLAAGILAVICFCRKSDFTANDGRIEKKKILWFMLLLLLILQTAFTIYSSVMLRGFYIEIFNNTGKEIQTLIQDDIAKVIGQGVSYDQIYDFESYAEDVMEKAPMIDSIALDGEQLAVTASESYINTIIRKMLIDTATILVTSMFIAAEIINYMMISIGRRAGKIIGAASHDKQLSIRVSSFLIHVACYLPVSFIPVMMHEFTGGAASDLILGLPVMVLFAVGFVFTLLAGNWSVRIGWRKLLFAGVALVVASSLLAGFTESAAVLVVARGIYGAAYALIYIAIREFATAGTDRQERSEGLAQVTAGLYAGINIGAVLGAMIYESVGFRGVFVISSAIGILAMFVVKYYCVVPRGPAAGENAAETAAEWQETGVLTVLKNRDMIRLSLLIIAPLAITVMFFEYFLPIYAVKAEITSADIGRAFLINGIAIAYAAPRLVKLFSGRISERTGVFLFTVLMAAGFAVFGFTGGAAGVLLAAGIMGVAEGAALVSQNMIMLDLDIAKTAGTSRMLSVYATVRKLSQAAGPQIFAVFMLLGHQSGMIAFGLVMALCSTVYFLYGRIR